ncbi:SIR2 family protein [Methylobacterium sp. E-025]|uniref:SIR2 family protein n=1 Tax=Methylobacterium sp. E-025 TaxID=2836561 RepID=UPI001FBB7C83|nr:SIR2 family protein [Methylobacterium sp. E-025]MCJ2112906.1 SIR2 family protein [Methylobacterium sp. E-025]
MPIDLTSFVKDIQPSRTVLLFGAGSSIPSGAPSVQVLQAHFEKIFGVSSQGYSLAEQTSIIEQNTRDRRRLIEELQSKFKHLNPTGAILNLPLYDWKSLYSTNYDELIEVSYKRRNRALNTYSTNFDFGLREDSNSTQYFKLHGTISKDVSFGDRSRIILTEADYDLTDEYRDQLFDRLKADVGASHLIIIGHSLADPDIKFVVNRALSLINRSGLQSRITLLLYTRDDGRATLFEGRGVEVVFGGLDDFFAGLVARIEPKPALVNSKDPLDRVPALRPVTVEVSHAIENQNASFSAMYNGWPASYGNIKSGHSFQRTAAYKIVEQFVRNESAIAVLIGPSGVGKTTAARQVLAALAEKGFHAWEHKEDQNFVPSRWRDVALYLKESDLDGVLFVDESHRELASINELVESLHRDQCKSLRFLLASTSYNWGPRIKSPIITKNGEVYAINKIVNEEVDRLLNLVDTNSVLRELVEERFAGYSRIERRRRLTHRCEADMFVCLKNIFSSEKFDDIILREYATLDGDLQDVYKIVAAMENAGVHVHRQLVIRLLGLQPMQLSSILSRLEDIVHEVTVDEKQGVYAWRGRHRVIMGIVADHKYYDKNKRYDLFEKVIDNIRPSYDIEVRTIRELCNVETGLATITNLKDQNVLLRKLISTAPGERVPRHRLIRNLIEQNDFDAADTEIKVFRSDFRMDAPTARYKINLSTARAVRTKGLMTEDRVALLDKAREIAASLADRHKNSTGVISAYCEVGIEIAKLTGRGAVFEAAIHMLKQLEDRTGDAEISRSVARLERRISTVSVETSEIDSDATDTNLDAAT